MDKIKIDGTKVKVGDFITGNNIYMPEYILDGGKIVFFSKTNVTFGKDKDNWNSSVPFGWLRNIKKHKNLESVIDYKNLISRNK